MNNEDFVLGTYSASNGDAQAIMRFAFEAGYRLGCIHGDNGTYLCDELGYLPEEVAERWLKEEYKGG